MARETAKPPPTSKPKPPREKDALIEAADAWREAKAGERAARERLAVIVREGVAREAFSETKAAKWTGIPRMTIRKMLGK